MRRKIIFTGGSTAGHITPNIPLIEEFNRKAWKTYCFVLGSKLEKTLLDSIKVSLCKISAGKHRRYFDFKNFLEPFKILKGIIQAAIYIHQIRPNVIFSKGGYLAFPVAIGAWINRVAFVLHESDTIPSLTTKLVYPLSVRVCRGLPNQKHSKAWNILGFKMNTTYTGIPIRQDLIKNRERALFNKSKNKKPNLLVLGGGLGSEIINRCIRQSLDILLARFRIVHICGAGKTNPNFVNIKGYKQYEFVYKDFFKLLMSADLVITRGGATVLYELLFLNKPSLIIPLSRKASRGEQIANANFFASKHYGQVLLEEDLDTSKLVEKLLNMKRKQAEFASAMSKAFLPSSKELIIKIIENNLKKVVNEKNEG